MRCQSVSGYNFGFLPDDNVNKAADLFWYAALLYALVYSPTLALSNTDGLTGILNRRAMEARLDLEWSRALRDRSSLSVSTGRRFRS